LLNFVGLGVDKHFKPKGKGSSYSHANGVCNLANAVGDVANVTCILQLEGLQVPVDKVP